MKSTSVRGTPVNSISRNNGQGWNSQAKPKGYSGTVNKQFEGDQKGNREEGISTGTPYQSRSVNDDIQPPENRMKYGEWAPNGQGNMNEPRTNGNGVVFDGISRDGDYLAPAAHTLDSPVVEGSPRLATGAVRRENIEHLGQGKGAAPSQADDELLPIGGVMSRGMLGTSTPKGGVKEMLEDDVLANLGAGGAIK